MKLLRPLGVYRPQGDTWLLADALRNAGIPPGGDVLEICCGTGALTIVAARTRPKSMTAVDVCRRATLATRFNTAIRGLRVTVEHADAFDRVWGRQFDLVLANPPYVPGVSDLPTRGRSRAWNAGADGRAVLDRLCAHAFDLLAPGGSLLTVHSALCGTDTTLNLLRETGLKASVVARAEEPFGPVMRRRADRLRDLGLIAPGQHHEELVVIRADRLLDND
ncbi:HemK2/MTQ2 family protein methyltransferase [Actinophytocola algeriensis]|uniref:Release factor glutamine methyltransferase n=1 Tax=Actinophytocola algeriensis TaxID=1768010 RepID=A0A7W7QD76_9PSEU|nr:HemK2/MTQ2 family protein methyltransferase [Actinophytocola algeriensis]MBB4911495.1 release factor glutamine methyltransferase [Actinophytocola algeriensis]MBE1473517.1 release factor glutamine methyltransferase [Actinophytocola algeriensis]